MCEPSAFYEAACKVGALLRTVLSKGLSEMCGGAFFLRSCLFEVGALLLKGHGKQSPPRPEVICEACFDVMDVP